MTATIIVLADHRKRREIDPLMLWLDGAEFLALATIAPLFALVACVRIIHQSAHDGQMRADR